MGKQTETPGIRLARLAQNELTELRDQLALARLGRDRALHRARKTLQRMRAIVRLLEPIDPVLSARENLRLSRLRKRLAPLRDAAARRQTFRVLAARSRWKAHAAALRALAALETPRHEVAWQARPADADFWGGIDQECALLGRRMEAWPFARLDEDAIDAALLRAKKRLRKGVRAAAGEHAREPRHELRRKLRRYANLRRAADVARKGEDRESEKLLDLAKRCGHEGDLWLAVASARRALRTRPEFHAVAQALEAERRALCRRHDRLLKRHEIG